MEELLKNPSLGKRFQGGYVWVLRLCVQDYHRYIYPDNARESRRVKILGILHTVNPAANDAYPIYKENSREFSILKTENFRTVLMMEVGALMVGKIENCPRKPFNRGFSFLVENFFEKMKLRSHTHHKPVIYYQYE